jgi:hypothetical protein
VRSPPGRGWRPAGSESCVVKQKTAKARFARFLRNLGQWLWQHMHDTVREQHKAIGQKLRAEGRGKRQILAPNRGGGGGRSRGRCRSRGRGKIHGLLVEPHPEKQPISSTVRWAFAPALRTVRRCRCSSTPCTGQPGLRP